MKYLIAGAGAIGAYIGARMSKAGHNVTLFARGAHLQAMQEGGVEVKSPEGDFVARPMITGSLEDIGTVDIIFLGVKAHGLTALAPQLAPVLGPGTTVVSTQNGIPWWYFEGFGGKWNGARLERVDPGGVIAAAIPARQVVGSIVYFSTEIIAPGVIQHISGNRISLGEPDGSRSDRSHGIAGALISSGLRAPITARLRQEIWVKVLGNASFNPVSALTRATLAQMVGDEGVRSVIRNIMQEVEAVAHKLGMDLPVSIDQRISGADKIGEHKTSMLQDLEAGRPMELEALVGAVVELGEKVGLPMTCTKTVYNCARLLSQSTMSEHNEQNTVK